MGDDNRQKGALRGFSGSVGSGIAHLTIETPTGVIWVPCENGPTARALISMFGSIKDAIDAEIVYSIGDFGLLEHLEHPEN